jgi:hypothetical protein
MLKYVFGGSDRCLLQGANPAFAWNENKENPVRIAGKPVKIRTENRYRYTSLHILIVIIVTTRFRAYAS